MYNSLALFRILLPLPFNTLLSTKHTASPTSTASQEAHLIRQKAKYEGQFLEAPSAKHACDSCSTGYATTQLIIYINTNASYF